MWGSVRLKPGVNVEQTPTLLEAGIAQSSLIRFRDSLVEKLGGWQKFYPFTVSGVPKAMHAWADLNNVNHLAIGTTTFLGLITSGSLQDITPQTFLSNAPTTAIANAPTTAIYFSTTINTPTVGIFDPNIANVTVLDYVFFNTPVWIPTTGVILFGLYPITQITGVNSYQITATMSATASVTNAQGETPLFTTTAGSATVTVEIDGMNAVPGQQVVFPIHHGDVTVTAAMATTTIAVTAVNPGSPALPVQIGVGITGAGVLAGTEITGFPTILISSGTYTPGTGAVSLSTSASHGLAPGVLFALTGVTGTGSFASLDGYWVATAGTTGTTLNFTAPTGLTLTITGGNVKAGGGVGLYTINNSQSVVSETMTIGNGISIQGAYTILTAPNANTFTIAASSQATFSGTFLYNGGNGESAGNVQLLYYLNLGPPAVGVGYGLGGYGLGGYGTGQVPASMTGTDISATDWSVGNWGEILISNPTGGGLFSFDPTGGFANAGLLLNAPVFNTGAFIAMPQQQIIAFGSTIQTALGPLQDPMLVRYCDISNFNQWTAASNNQAGSFRLSPGSKIVGGRAGPNNPLLWTDLDLWTMTYLGYPLVWAFNKVAGSAGLIGLRAHCELQGNVMWMSPANFYQAGPNGVGVMPCPVWDAVFQNLSTLSDSVGPVTRKCWAWANTPFNEAWFFYPSAASAGECDSFVKVNQVENAWDYGPLPRSCGISQSVLGNPIAASPTSLIYQHEVNPDADVAPLAWSYTTGYFMIGEGEEFFIVDLVIPDFKFGTFGGSTVNASIQMTFNLVDDPSGPVTSIGPFTVTVSTPEIQDLRLRGRLMSFTISGNDPDSFSRLGRVRYRFAPDGRR